MKQLMHRHQSKCDFGIPLPIKVHKEKANAAYMSYHTDHNCEWPNGKNIHTVQPLRCNSVSQIAEMYDSCDISTTCRKQLHKCQQTGGIMAAKTPSSAIISE